MNNKIYIKNNIRLSQKDSPFNIGIDIKASNFNIVGEKFQDYYSYIDYIEYNTDLFIDSINKNSEEQIYTLLYPRSSISNKNLFLCNGVGLIDPNYRDSIKVRFKYFSQPKDLIFFNDKVFIKIDMDKIYKDGDKIAQIVFVKNFPVSFNYVPELMPSDRFGGFGSTGI